MKFNEDDKSINELIEKAMTKLKTLIETSSVVGEKVEFEDGSFVIPVSKVSVGFVVGGGEYGNFSRRKIAKHYPMTGGSSGGISISPVGFLIKKGNDVSFVLVDKKDISDSVFKIFEAVANKLKKEGENEK